LLQRLQAGGEPGVQFGEPAFDTGHGGLIL
jgi:hypothetical protein